MRLITMKTTQTPPSRASTMLKKTIRDHGSANPPPKGTGACRDREFGQLVVCAHLIHFGFGGRASRQDHGRRSTLAIAAHAAASMSFGGGSELQPAIVNWKPTFLIGLQGGQEWAKPEIPLSRDY